MENSDPWGQLVSTTDLESEPIHISKNKFTIGRGQGNDLCLAENGFVSSSHCFIERDETNGTAWLYDTSTNGTLLNLSKKLVRQKAELKHGDEIYVVNRKGDTNMNVAFLFQDVNELKREQELNSSEADTSNEANCTLTYECSQEDSAEEGMSDETPAIKKRKLSESAAAKVSSSDAPLESTSRGPGEGHSERQQTQTDEMPSESKPSSSSSSTSPSHSKSADSVDCGPSGSHEKPTPESAGVMGVTDNTKAKSSTPVATGADVVSSSTSNRCSVPETGASSDSTKNVVELSASDTARPSGSEEKPSTVAGSNVDTSAASLTKSAGAEVSSSAVRTDGLEESLVCIICQELLHNCVSVQPCMHSFCAGCYSEWMQRSNECPSCRMKVDRINKNHLVNNLVEAFLKANPDKKRPDDELKELDAKNKITRDMLQPKRRRRYSDDDTASDEEYSGDDDNENVDGPVGPGPAQPGWRGGIFGFAVNLPTVRPLKTVCRQCPEYTAATGNSAGASTSAAATASCSASAPDTAVAPAFVCAPNQTHILCQCCMQPMPDRGHDRRSGIALPAQNCVVCHRAYCHMYWGCQRPGCQGCLAKFKEFPVGREILAGLILENAFESEIFQKYLVEHNITTVNLLEECCQRLAAGTYTCTDQRSLANGDAAVCFSCCRRNLSELAYQYRKDIPRTELPAEATANRPDCYWGRNCRTQKGKQIHARNYNHICEQTRMA